MTISRLSCPKTSAPSAVCGEYVTAITTQGTSGFSGVVGFAQFSGRGPPFPLDPVWLTCAGRQVRMRPSVRSGHLEGQTDVSTTL